MASLGYYPPHIMDGAENQISTSAVRPWKTWAVRAAIILAVVIMMVYSAQWGLQFRRWMWDTTDPIRFRNDVNRGFYWGRQAITEGYLNQYVKMQPQQPNDENWLDYGPLRLGVMTMWAKWASIHYPAVKSWNQDRSYALTAPVLQFNLFMESLGIVCAFFLTRFWARQRVSNHLDSANAIFFRGWIPGLFAAALLWFNPAIVLSAYGWPTWDLWIIPMFLLAALLASYDWWFIAGIAIGVGAMFKGQQLLSIPVFVMWAIVVGRPKCAGKLLAGPVLAIAVIASPWLVTYLPADGLAHARDIQSRGQPAMVPAGTFAIPRLVDVPALIWITGVLLTIIAMPFALRWKPKAISVDPADANTPRWRRWIASPWAWHAMLALVTTMVVIWPWLLHRNRPHWLTGLVLAIAVNVAIRVIRPRTLGYTAAGALGIALLLCMSIFSGSSAWYDCGIHFGTIHWPHMTVGGANNLPAILVYDYGWDMNDLNAIALTLPAHSVWTLWGSSIDVSIGELLRTVFVITLIGSAVGVGVHARRKDPRLLIALTTPWLMLFCFLPQVHERYLLFAAGISCICAGISTGMTLLGVLLSIVTAMMTLHTMLEEAGPQQRYVFGVGLARQFPAMFDQHAGALLYRVTDRCHPDLGFAIILIGLVFLYFTLSPRRVLKPFSDGTTAGRVG